jgi:WD40 repeat protein
MATGARLSEPSARQHGGVLGPPPRRARRLALAGVAGLALVVALAVAGVILAIRRPPPHGLVATLSGPGGQATCSAAFSPDGTTLAVAGCNDSVFLWDVAARRWSATLTSPGCPLGGQVAFSPDGGELALFGGHAVSLSGHRHHPATCLWDVTARREVTLTDPPLLAFDSTQGAFSPRGTTLAVADNSGNIYLWDLAARRVTAAVPAAAYCAPSCPVAFSPDGTMLAVGETEPSGGHGHVYLWDLAARRWAGVLTAPGRGITTLAFNRDGILAAGADDDHAYLWDVATRRLTAAIAPPVNVAQGNASISKYGTPYPVAGAFDQTTTAAFSPDGTIVAVDATFGYGTYLYDVATGNRVATLTDPRGQLDVAPQVVFSPDGMMMAVTEARGRTYLWRPSAG